MAEGTAERQQVLREEYHRQTARIHWHELQTYYAHGSVIEVSPDLSLVDVAVQLGMDNTDSFQRWIAAGEVAGVSDEQALEWYEANTLLWAGSGSTLGAGAATRRRGVTAACRIKLTASSEQ